MSIWLKALKIKGVKHNRLFMNQEFNVAEIKPCLNGVTLLHWGNVGLLNKLANLASLMAIKAHFKSL